MNQVVLAVYDAVDCVRHVSADLSHPEPIGDGPDTADLDPARREIHEE